MEHFTSKRLNGTFCKSSIFAIIFLLTVFQSKLYGQTKIYANTVTKVSPNGMSSLLGCGTLGGQPCFNTVTVDNPNNALTADNATFALVKSSGGTVLGLASYSGELEIKFPTDLPANTTSYIRVDFDADLMNALLGGNLGGTLANIAGIVALGNHTIEVGARNSSGTTILSGVSSGNFANQNLRLIKDANGYFYIAIKPNQIYDRVYIKDATDAILGLGTTNSTKVYNAFYFSGTDPCAQVFATSYEGTGLTVDALGLGGAGVTNPERAIDAEQTNYSQLSLGALGVAGSISQNFHFTGLSNADDGFNLKFSVSPALITAGIANNITVTAYNGGAQVYSQSVSSSLSLDLLGLLNSGQIATVPFAPGVAFDRVQVTLSSLLNANLTQTIRVYGLTRSVQAPTFVAPTTNNLSVCYNTAASLMATTSSNNELRWYDVIDGGTALATVPFNGTFTTPPLTQNKIYYVSARRIGCTEESGRVAVNVTVNSQIVFNGATLNNGSVGSPYSKQIDVATGGTPNYTYILSNGSSLPAGLTLSASGLITGTPTGAGTTTFSVTVTDNKGCTNAATYNLTINAQLALAPGNLPNGITGNVYPVQTIPSATGGVGPYSYVATGLPPGLTFNPATREITGTPTQSGNYTIPVTVTDANGNSVTANYTVKITDPLVLPPATLANGTTGNLYLPQTIPLATGGTTPYTYSATGLPPGLTFNPTTREITGTPTQSGNYTIPVTVTDADGQTVTTNYSITVIDPLILPDATLAAGQENVVYTTQTIPSATGGVGPYSYVATGLPPGLTFNPANREISGTPTQAGSYLVRVTVTDSEGRTASNNYQINVTGTLSLPPATLANGAVTHTYPTQTLPAVSGGNAPYTYTVTNLPPGLSFDSNTREITGTPTLGGTFTLTLTATDDDGKKASTDYTITVTVDAPVVAANAPICSGSAATLSVSNLQSGVTYNWYPSTGSTALATNNNGTFNTPIVNSTTVFYVEAVSGTAVSSRVAVTVTVKPLATATDIIASDASTCSGSSATIVASTSTVTNPVFTWYSDAALTNLVFVGPSFTTPALTANTTYYVTVKGDDKCENAPNNAKAVNITVKAYATAADVAIAGGLQTCANSSTVLTASSTTVTNPVFTWYNDAALTNPVFVGSSFTTPALTANTTYYVTVKGDDKCENAPNNAKAVNITVKAYATAADVAIAGGLQTCVNSSTVLTASSTTVTNPVFTWYNDAALTNPVFVGASFTTPALISNTTYYVTVKGDDKCENTSANAKTVNITVKAYATTMDIAASDASTCSGSSATIVASTSTVANPVFTWYSDAALTNSVFVGLSFTTPALTSNTTYYVTVKGDDKCENTIGNGKAVNITVKGNAIAADVVIAGGLQTCANSSTVLTASSTTITNPVFTWYSDAALSTAVFIGSSFTTPALTSNTTYYVTVKGDEKCENTSANAKMVSITVKGNATAADISAADASTCSGSSATIVASTSTVANPVFTWYSNAALTNPVFVGSSFTTSALTTNTTYYVTVKGDDKCENAPNNAKAINITVKGNATAADVVIAGGLQTCANASAVLTASSTTVTNPVFTWYSDVALSNAVFVGPSFTTPVLTANTIYYVTVKGDNKCENTIGNARVASITVNALPNNPVLSTVGTSICSGDATTLTISNAQSGVTYEWYSAATAGNLLFTGTVYTTGVLTAPTDYYVLAIGAGGCNNNGGRVKISVTVNAKPTVPTVASASVNVCNGSSATLSVTNPQAGVTYNWYTTTNSGTPVGTGTTFTTPAITANTTYYVEAANGSCTSSSRTSVNVITSPVPVAPASVTAANGTVCAGSTTLLTVNNPNGSLTYRWYSSSLGGSMLAEGVTFTPPASSTPQTYYVESVTASGCASPTRTAINVNVLPVLATPVVTVQSVTESSVTFAWAAITGATAYEVSLNNGSTWGAPINSPIETSYVVANLKPDQSITIIVRAKGQTDCQTSANSSPVTGKGLNRLGNEIYIPNAFTPNNDGKNDTFLLYGNSVSNAKMSVYSQWGQLVFQSNNMANGWNGTYKGQDQPMGVYVYMMDITFSDGTKTFKKGTITLIR